MITAYFQKEANEIELIEESIQEVQSSLTEAVEAAQETLNYTPEEDETITATVIKKVLKDFFADFKDIQSQSAKKEVEKLKSLEKAILDIEKQLKEYKLKLRLKNDELEFKLQLKRVGGDAYKEEKVLLIAQIKKDLSLLNPSNKDDKKKITALNKDKAKELILHKLFGLIHTELMRYLNEEKRGVIQSVENLWVKYAVSKTVLEEKRVETLGQLNGFLKTLGYLK